MAILFIKKLSDRHKLRFILGVFAVILVGIFLFLKIVPFGHITYTKNYASFWRSGKGFIYNFTPQERINEIDKWPKIIGDPVYFSVFTPRTFTRAKLIVTYYSKLTNQTPIIEAGVLADKLVWRYDLKPLENKIIADLTVDWHKIKEGNLILWQKNKQYENIENFVNDLSQGSLKGCDSNLLNCLATYNYIANYQITPSEFKEINNNFSIPLQGSHVLYLYLNEGFWQFKADFRAASKNTKNTPLKLILTKEEKIIKEAVLEGLDIDWQTKPEKELVLESDLEAGLYKLEIKISDDVIINNFYNSRGQFVFANRFWPVNYDQAINIYTDADYVQVKALDPANLQDISFAEQNFSINEPYEQYEFTSNTSGIKEIKLAKDNLILENNGVFSISIEDLFNPYLRKIDRYFKPQSNLNYIIASYEAPEIVSEDKKLMVASADFMMKGAYREWGKYNFMISIPGLKTENGEDDYLAIKEVRVEFSGRNLWQKIFNISD